MKPLLLNGKLIDLNAPTEAEALIRDFLVKSWGVFTKQELIKQLHIGRSTLYEFAMKYPEYYAARAYRGYPLYGQPKALEEFKKLSQLR